MAVLIDTSLLIEFERNPGAVPDAQDFAISVISVSELLHGVERAEGAVRTRRSAFIEQLVASFPVLDVTTAVARAHAQIWAALEVRGERIGAHDLWIAATAVTHGFELATRNTAEFGRIPGLRLLDVR